MSEPLVCPNCDKPVAREDEHRSPFYRGGDGKWLCNVKDWRSEALRLRGEYERGFQEAREMAAKVADEDSKDSDDGAREHDSRKEHSIEAAMLRFRAKGMRHVAESIRALLPRGGQP